MSRILIIAEHDGATLNISTSKCVTCAQAIGGDIDILVMGQGIDAVAAEAAALDSVSRVLAVNAEHLAAPLAVNLAAEVVGLSADYTHLVGPSTTFGRDLMPRIAALLGVNQVSDIMSVEGSHTFKRPIYAGNAIVTVEAPSDAVLVATVRVASWPAAAGGNSAPIEAASAEADLPAHTRYIGLESAVSDRPDLQTAATVVAGGRAFGSEENFELLYTLADALGAGVGATRAAVDAGYCANDMQVGQTGKIIAPDLYIAIGISGAIQHLTGIKDAGTIVAINKDEEAPIFEVADIGLVGDLNSAVPELTDALRK